MSTSENFTQRFGIYLEPADSELFANPRFEQQVMAGVDVLYAILSAHAAKPGSLDSVVCEQRQTLDSLPLPSGHYETSRYARNVSGQWHIDRRLALPSLLGETPIDCGGQPMPALTVTTTVHVATKLDTETYEDIAEATNITADTARRQGLSEEKRIYYEEQRSVLGVRGTRVPRRVLGFLTRGYNYDNPSTNADLRKQLGSALITSPTPAVAASVRIRAEFPLGGAASDTVLRVASGDQSLFTIGEQEPTAPDSNAARYRLLGTMLTLPNTHDIP